MQNILFAGIIPLVIALISVLVRWLTKDKGKEITIISPNGKEKHLTVRFDMSNEDLAEKIRDALNYERHIQETIKKVLERDKNMAANFAKDIDIIIQNQNKSIGVEIIKNLESISTQRLKDMTSIPQPLEKILLFYNKAGQDAVQAISDAASKFGKIAVKAINIPDDNEKEATARIKKALAN